MEGRNSSPAGVAVPWQGQLGRRWPAGLPAGSRPSARGPCLRGVPHLHLLRLLACAAAAALPASKLLGAEIDARSGSFLAIFSPPPRAAMSDCGLRAFRALRRADGLWPRPHRNQSGRPPVERPTARSGAIAALMAHLGQCCLGAPGAGAKCRDRDAIVSEITNAKRPGR